MPVFAGRESYADKSRSTLYRGAGAKARDLPGRGTSRLLDVVECMFPWKIASASEANRSDAWRTLDAEVPKCPDPTGLEKRTSFCGYSGVTIEAC